jgi:hypothetical protein
MPKQSSNLLVLGLVLFVLSVALAQDATVLRGRVLAEIYGVYETGTSERYQLFIFGVESIGGKGKSIVSPVIIMYSGSDFDLPKSFFNYSKRYELKVRRDPLGDGSLKSLAYIKIVDPDGKEVQPPISKLRLMHGVPKDILKMDEKLPQYKLFPGDYGILKEN